MTAIIIYIDDVSDDQEEYLVRETGSEFDDESFDDPKDALEEANSWMEHYRSEGIAAEIVKPGWM